MVRTSAIQLSRNDAAMAEASAAIASEPRFAGGYAQVTGLILIWSGRAEEAVKSIEQALRMDPGGPVRFVDEWLMCAAHAQMAEWEQAIERRQKSMASNPSFFWPYVSRRLWAAGAHGPGRLTPRPQLRKLAPDFTVRILPSRSELDEDPRRIAAVERSRCKGYARQVSVRRLQGSPEASTKDEGSK